MIKIAAKLGEREILATVYERQKTDENGSPIWVDEKSRIGKCFHRVDEFVFYQPINKVQFVKIHLSSAEVKALAKFIEEQSQIETEEFIDV